MDPSGLPPAFALIETRTAGDALVLSGAIVQSAREIGWASAEHPTVAIDALAKKRAPRMAFPENRLTSGGASSVVFIATNLEPGPHQHCRVRDSLAKSMKKDSLRKIR